MTTDELALLAAIRADPACDTVRLAYADLLEENREAERAEFIRVQCELSRLDCHHPVYTPWCSTCEELPEMRRREIVLFNQIRPQFGYAVKSVWLNEAERAEVFPLAIVRRGFIAEVRGELAALRGGVCVECRGDGKWYDDEGYYERGWRRCKPCHGSGRTEGVLRKLVREHPIEVATVTNKQPMPMVHGHSAWFDEERMQEEYTLDEDPHPDSNLPSDIANLLSGELEWHESGRVFATETAARAALSRALLKEALESAETLK